VLTDAPLPVHDQPVADGCGGCTRCLDGCPTGAIVAAGVVDARRCLAWLVQAEGVFPREHRVALGDRIYGCDVCQEVCPPSTRSRREAGGAGGDAGDGPVPVPDPVRVPAPGGADDGAEHRGTWVPILDLLASDDAALLGRFGRWYIPRRDVRYLRRNALLALANAAPVPIDDRVSQVLERALDHRDPLIRGHAVWAARRLGALDLLARRPRLLDDPDPDVRAEMAGEVPSRAGSTP